MIMMLIMRSYYYRILEYMRSDALCSSKYRSAHWNSTSFQYRFQYVQIRDWTRRRGICLQRGPPRKLASAVYWSGDSCTPGLPTTTSDLELSSYRCRDHMENQRRRLRHLLRCTAELGEQHRDRASFPAVSS